MPRNKTMDALKNFFRNHLLFFAVFAVATIPRLACLFWQLHSGAIRIEDGSHLEYLAAARNLVEHGTLGAAYQFTGGLFAFAARSPGLPLLLALFLWLGLDPILWGKLAATAAGIIGIPLTGLLCRAFAARLAPRLKDPAMVTGMLLCGCSPFGVYLSAKLLPEIWFYASATLSLLLLELALRRRGQGDGQLRLFLLAGLSLGLGTLIKESSAFVCAGAIWWIGLRLGTRQAMMPIACLLAAALLANLPWSVRNLIRTGHPEPLTSVSGLNLHLGFNELTDGGCDQHYLPLSATVECQDEFAVARAYRQAALTWIREHPGRALALVPAKLWRFFRPFPDPVKVSREVILTTGSWWLAVYLLTALFLVICRHPAERREMFIFLGPFLMVFCVAHSIFPGLARYRHAFEPVILVPAALCLAELWLRSSAWMTRKPK